MLVTPERGRLLQSLPLHARRRRRVQAYVKRPRQRCRPGPSRPRSWRGSCQSGRWQPGSCPSPCRPSPLCGLGSRPTDRRSRCGLRQDRTGWSPQGREHLRLSRSTRRQEELGGTVLPNDEQRPRFVRAGHRTGASRPACPIETQAYRGPRAENPDLRWSPRLWCPRAALHRSAA
jgi:hypothetical protein